MRHRSILMPFLSILADYTTYNSLTMGKGGQSVAKRVAVVGKNHVEVRLLPSRFLEIPSKADVSFLPIICCTVCCLFPIRC